MTPDELHTHYYQINPDGNHPDGKASKETLTLLFDLERRMEEKLETKVDFSTFTWVLGVLMVIVIGTFGVIYARIEKIGDITNSTNITVSEIQGKLEPFNFIIQ